LKPRSGRKPNSNVRAAEASKAFGIFRPVADARHIAVAVSGGSDSLALLVLAAEFARAASIYFTALTFDHGLRAESAVEAEWVRDWCESRGIACQVSQWEGLKPLTGIQAAARLARYDALTREATRIGADVLLTGHTANDQAETVVMRQARTQSAASLAGIWPETQWNGVRIVRPLLGMTRETLRDMLRTRNMSWLDDPSNVNPRFERVRVRGALAEGDIAGFSQVADIAQSEVVAARLRVAEFFVHMTKDRFGVVGFPLEAFRGLGHLVQHLALKQAFAVFGAGEAVSGAERDRLIGWLQDPQSRRRTLGGVVFAIAKGQVGMMREVARIADLIVPEGGEIEWDKRFRLEVPRGAKIVPMGRSGHFRRDPSLSSLVQQGLPCVLVNEKSVTAEFTCLRTLDFANETPMLGSSKIALAATASGEDNRL
jgi:tRNA(Ile)-lysidine synthase